MSEPNNERKDKFIWIPISVEDVTVITPKYHTRIYDLAPPPPLSWWRRWMLRLWWKVRGYV